MLKSSLKQRTIVFLFVTKRVLFINFFWWKHFRSNSPWRSLCRHVLLQEDHGTGGERKRREITQWSHRGKQLLKHQISSGTFLARWFFTTDSPNSQTYISRHDMGGRGGGLPHTRPQNQLMPQHQFMPQPPLMHQPLLSTTRPLLQPQLFTPLPQLSTGQLQHQLPIEQIFIQIYRWSSCIWSKKWTYSFSCYRWSGSSRSCPRRRGCSQWGHPLLRLLPPLSKSEGDQIQLWPILKPSHCLLTTTLNVFGMVSSLFLLPGPLTFYCSIFGPEIAAKF